MISVKNRNLLIVMGVMAALLVALFIYVHLDLEDIEAKIIKERQPQAPLFVSWDVASQAANGEPVIARMTVVNPSGRTVRLPAASVPVLGFGFKVERILGSPRTRVSPLRLREQGMPKVVSFELAPGECRTWAVDLSKQYDLKPGRYRVRGYYDLAVIARSLKLDLRKEDYHAGTVENQNKPRWLELVVTPPAKEQPPGRG